MFTDDDDAGTRAHMTHHNTQMPADNFLGGTSKPLNANRERFSQWGRDPLTSSPSPLLCAPARRPARLLLGQGVGKGM
jgi:hypothetical protein